MKRLNGLLAGVRKRVQDRRKIKLIKKNADRSAPGRVDAGEKSDSYNKVNGPLSNAIKKTRSVVACT